MLTTAINSTRDRLVTWGKASGPNKGGPLADAVCEFTDLGKRLLDFSEKMHLVDPGLSKVILSTPSKNGFEKRVLEARKRAMHIWSGKQAGSLSAAQEKPYHVIVALYDHLDQMLKTISNSHSGNFNEQNALAEEFTQNMLECAEHTLQTYVNYVDGKIKANEARTIERQGVRIFTMAKSAAAKAKEWSVPHDKSHKEWQANVETHTRFNGVLAAKSNPKAFYNALREKRGPIQMSLLEQAERLGPKYGEQLLLGVEDVFLAGIDVLRAVKDAGIAIDMNVFPGREARFENFGFVPPEGHTALTASVDMPKQELPLVDPVIKQNAINRSKSDKN